MIRILHHRAGIIELRHNSKPTDPRGNVLLLAPGSLHLLITVAPVCPHAIAARSVSAGHTPKPFIVILKTLNDAVKGHELEIVLMRANAKVRDPRQSGSFIDAVGNEQLGFGLMKFHDDMNETDFTGFVAPIDRLAFRGRYERKEPQLNPSKIKGRLRAVFCQRRRIRSLSHRRRSKLHKPSHDDLNAGGIKQTRHGW